MRACVRVRTEARTKMTMTRMRKMQDGLRPSFARIVLIDSGWLGRNVEVGLWG